MLEGEREAGGREGGVGRREMSVCVNTITSWKTECVYLYSYM